MKPLAWQPGTAMRLAVLIAASRSGDSSGKPYVQPGGRAVRGRGVEHDRVRVLDEVRRRDGRRVRQTQKRNVRAVEQLSLRFNIVVQLGRQGQQVDVRALGQPVINAQTGCTGTAVDENGRFFVMHILSLTSG